ncbi:MAG: galactose mutarotase [Clostridiales bacterium]|nr:galactose mutarotase [Clostridiales bacterium]
MKNYPKQTIYNIGSDCLEVGISDVGACLQYIRLKTPNGYRDMCLGFNSLQDRIESETYCGAVIGRISNRIANAQYTLNGQTYKLTPNNGTNTLHGGVEGFDSRLFDVCERDNCVQMTLISPDGDQGFGGTLKFTVTFCVQGNALDVTFHAVSDSDTVWAPTMHPYFNLGCADGIFDTVLQINANEYTPMDDRQIPTGEVAPVKGTVFDFTMPKAIGKDFDLASGPLARTHGYDHNFVLNGEHAVTAYNTSSGVKMDIYTNLPGLQFYSGNYFKGRNGDKEYKPFDGFALEPQFFPNSVNQQGFKKPLLKAGEPKQYYIRYVFNNI